MDASITRAAGGNTMSSRSRFGSILAAALITIAGAGAARSTAAKQPPDLSGEWRLDAAHSDMPRRGGPGGGGPRAGGWGGGMGGEGHRGGRHGGGPGGRGAGEGGGEGGGERGGMRPGRLPDDLHVEQHEGALWFADSTGARLLSIHTDAAPPDSAERANGVQQLAGQWKGDRLVVRHPSWRGGNVTDTYSLGDKGRTLTIRTQVDSDGTMPALDFKRVYTRVRAS